MAESLLRNQLRRGPLGTIAVVLIILLTFYVGAYWGTVQPQELPYLGTSPVFPRLHGGVFGDPGFRFNAWKKWRSFFAPIHWMDGRLRPHVWNLSP